MIWILLILILLENKKELTIISTIQTTGHHPLVAFDGLTGDILKAELLSKNVYSVITASNFHV